MGCSEETIRKLKKMKNSLYRNVNLKKCAGTSKKKGEKGTPRTQTLQPLRRQQRNKQHE